MNILKSVKKIPGGLMVVPLLLGAIINTFLAVRSGPCLMVHLLHYLWKSGAMPILAVFIFCNATTTTSKKQALPFIKAL